MIFSLKRLKVLSLDHINYHFGTVNFYGRLRLIRSVLRASKISVLKLIGIVILWVYYTIPFDSACFGTFGPPFSTFKFIYLVKDH